MIPFFTFAVDVPDDDEGDKCRYRYTHPSKKEDDGEGEYRFFGGQADCADDHAEAEGEQGDGGDDDAPPFCFFGGGAAYAVQSAVLSMYEEGMGTAVVILIIGSVDGQQELCPLFIAELCRPFEVADMVGGGCLAALVGGGRFDGRFGLCPRILRRAVRQADGTPFYIIGRKRPCVTALERPYFLAQCVMLFQCGGGMVIVPPFYCADTGFPSDLGSGDLLRLPFAAPILFPMADDIVIEPHFCPPLCSRVTIYQPHRQEKRPCAFP